LPAIYLCQTAAPYYKNMTEYQCKNEEICYWRKIQQ
jgi:hypothetical protein